MGRVLPVELKEFNAASLNGTYQSFGSALSNPAIKIMIFNTSNVDAYISKDSTTNMMRVPAFGAATLDESTLYFRGIDQEYYLPKGTQLTVKQHTVAGSSATTSNSLIAHIVTRIQP